MKSLNLIKPAFLVLVTLCFTALSLKAQVTKNVAVNNFSEVSVSAGIELIIKQGTTESAKIVADQDLVNEVVVEKTGDRVKVGWRENFHRDNRTNNTTVKVYITYKRLHDIAASSGSSIKTENILKTDRLNAEVSSGASIDGQIACEDFDLRTSSGASADLNGAIKNLTLQASSGSSVDALGLTAQYGRVITSSGASIKVNVSKSLETNTSSGSSIRYKGDPMLKDNSDPKRSNVSRI
ncbi:head GIN domain-containing protein [Pedobacter sp. L105]|uniref:head GIN domain-containing protein n=1 Tax=Pedobacter sp. L105 TaxID=1641871 RepID=UPI00131C6A28|nr:head GIN domain-containing protein [Pedobacter sp. L105]